MLITHSEIFPGTFASTTETAGYLPDQLGTKRTPALQRDGSRDPAANSIEAWRARVNAPLKSSRRPICPAAAQTPEP